MRLLLYNIRYGTGIGKRFHFPLPYCGYVKPVNGNFNRIVHYVKGLAPDIVGLVEADFGTYRSDRRNQAEHMAEELSQEAVYQTKYNSGSVMKRVPLLNKQGNAVLTNRRIEKTRFHYFKQGVKRLIIEVELEEAVLFLVHLSLKYRHRQYQLHDLHQLILGCTKPVIVAGDFNARWGQRELQLFLAATGLTSANTLNEASWPSRAPFMQLDYIFHSPQIKTKKFYSPRVKYSDHTPLVWDFEITPPTLEILAATG